MKMAVVVAESDLAIAVAREALVWRWGTGIK
jgi:hypothetical protein